MEVLEAFSTGTGGQHSPGSEKVESAIIDSEMPVVIYDNNKSADFVAPKSSNDAISLYQEYSDNIVNASRAATKGGSWH